MLVFYFYSDTCNLLIYNEIKTSFDYLLNPSLHEMEINSQWHYIVFVACLIKWSLVWLAKVTVQIRNLLGESFIRKKNLIDWKIEFKNLIFIQILYDRITKICLGYFKSLEGKSYIPTQTDTFEFYCKL